MEYLELVINDLENRMNKALERVCAAVRVAIIKLDDTEYPVSDAAIAVRAAGEGKIRDLLADPHIDDPLVRTR